MLKQCSSRIPAGLLSLLAGYTRGYFRKKPDDLALFGLYYTLELQKFQKEYPTLSIDHLIREFHKLRAERLCGNVFEKEMMKLGYKATSNEDVKFSELEIAIEEQEMWCDTTTSASGVKQKQESDSTNKQLGQNRMIAGRRPEGNMANGSKGAGCNKKVSNDCREKVKSSNVPNSRGAPFSVPGTPSGFISNKGRRSKKSSHGQSTMISEKLDKAMSSCNLSGPSNSNTTKISQANYGDVDK